MTRAFRFFVVAFCLLWLGCFGLGFFFALTSRDAAFADLGPAKVHPSDRAACALAAPDARCWPSGQP